MAQWWEEWELRTLVLASLSAQYFLVLLAAVRRFRIQALLSVLFRLVHIGSDALAILALATLFNRQKNGPGCHYARGSHDLELLWAPILVMHLGGQVAITSYNIEDNEKWGRHMLTSLSKVTIALYVLYKSWSADDKRLLAATILLFILVIIRSFQKALDLKSSSFDALRKASMSEKSVVRGNSDTQEERLDNFITDAKAVVCQGRTPGSWELPALPYQLFLDFPCPYYDRVEILRKFWRLDPKSAYQAIESVLSDMTSFLYTKDDSALPAMTTSFCTPNLTLKNVSRRVIFRRCTLALAYATVITAICLVHTSSHSKGRGDEDTWVTLVMLYGTLVLELVYLGMQTALRHKFLGRIRQHSLIGLLTENTWGYKFRALGLGNVAELLQCKDLVDQYFTYMNSSYSCEEITELVRQHVESAWKEYIDDNATYRRFNDARGEWTLGRKKCAEQLGWSLKRPFDETIILWHLATDICFQYMARRSPDDVQCARRCKVISNYMMHLLFANPEMLMPGSRKSLFTWASHEIKSILSKSRDETEFIRRVSDKCNQGSAPDSFIHNAWMLATILSGDELDDHGHVTSKWEVVQGVWFEMLCFSAGRCRGYLHAQALGGGVEYLSYVWVLLAYAGMETFPEKLQRREGQTVDGHNESLVHRGREDALLLLLHLLPKEKTGRMSFELVDRVPCVCISLIVCPCMLLLGASAF